MLEGDSPLRKLRIARNLTLREVAEQVGTNTGNLSRIERGESVSPLMAESLAKFYAPEIDERHVLYPSRYANWKPLLPVNQA